MDTSRFNSKVNDIFVGLTKDSQCDETYNLIKDCYLRFLALCEDVEEDYFQQQFIALVRSNEDFCHCLRTKNTIELQRFVTEMVDEDIVGPVREIFMALNNPALLKRDAAKKAWSRIRKLILLCNLQDFVSGEEQEPDKDTKPPSSSVVKVEKRVNAAKEREIRFNTAYRAFLEDLQVAFPGSEVDVLGLFDGIVAQSSNTVLEEFKKYLMPFVPKLIKGIQSNDFEEQKKVLDPYFGPSDSSWFKGLPLVNRMPVDRFWVEQMNNDENRTSLMKAVGELLSCMTGLDSLIKSPIVTHIRDKAMEIMRRDNVQASDFLPTSPNFSQSNMMQMVFELMHSLPDATDGKISPDDINKLVSSLTTGGDDIPDSFGEVFSPDMIDLDCFEMLGEIPGVGDAIAPVIAGAQGALKGHTCTPAFKSVQTPAWLERDEQ